MNDEELRVSQQAIQDLMARPDSAAILKGAEGMPRLFYHGTRAPEDFTAFSCDGPPLDDEGIPLSEDSGPDPTAYLGAHFAEERRVAAGFALRSHDWMRRRPHVYAEGHEPEPRVIAVALKAQNPAIFETEEDLLAYIFRKGTLSDDHLLAETMYRKYGIEDGTNEADVWLGRYDSDEELRREVHSHIFLERRVADEDEAVLREEAAGFAQTARLALQQDGFDGIRYGNRVEGGISWIAFDPAQILRAYVDRAPGGRAPYASHGRERFVCETHRNAPARTFRALSTPQGGLTPAMPAI